MSKPTQPWHLVVLPSSLDVSIVMRNRGWGPPVDQGLEFWSSDNVYYSGVSPCALSRMIGRFTGLFRMRQFTGTRDAP